MTSGRHAAEIAARAAQHNNQLAQEKSPYLLQHAHNPVDWYAWGEEAFTKARRENKPIFLSVGYSTCHWCHVMAHESFEDETTAAIMNREFVNIKVDREERPDVDRVYMTFVQATTGRGGWPMSVWLTPDLKPFVGGTYFPPEDRYGQPSFKKVLTGIAAAWSRDHEKISEQGTKIIDALRESQIVQASAVDQIGPATLAQAYQQFARTFDPNDGGFGAAPKFPRPATLNFLVRFYARNGGGGFQPMSEDHRQDADATAKSALEMVLLTLQKMAAGGMRDHIGGGFHRYSVDRYWHVPHFEKMLYDQAQLANAYLDAFQITRDPQYADVARDILDYVVRDMTAKEGGFFSAEDADSLDPGAAVYSSRRSLSKADDRRSESEPGAHRAPLQKKEGAFYVWMEKEIDEALEADSDIFKFHLGVQPDGNAPEGSDPHHELVGKNVLIERHTIAETAARWQKSEAEVRESLARSRQKLFSIRAKRPRPHLDDKIIAAWNGLTISAFARAAQVFDEPGYGKRATEAVKFLRDHLYDRKHKILYRTYRQGRGEVEAFADDYAFVIQGLLDLYEALFDVEWLKLAVELQETQDRLFFDECNGGYFSTSGADKNVPLRLKDDNDGAEPSASSVATLNLLRLAQIRNDKTMEERAQKAIGAFAATLSHVPSAMPQMLVALELSLSKPRQIVIAGKIDNPETKLLLREVHRHFAPNKVVLLADGTTGQEYLGRHNEAIRTMSPMAGRAAAYVCEDFTCQGPVTDPTALAAVLER